MALKSKITLAIIL